MRIQASPQAMQDEGPTPIILHHKTQKKTEIKKLVLKARIQFHYFNSTNFIFCIFKCR